MKVKENCDKCEKIAMSTHYVEGLWLCKHCISSVDGGFYFKEMGVENPEDPQGSTAHVRDIKDRRYDFKEMRTFYYSKEKPKTYFFLKG